MNLESRIKIMLGIGVPGHLLAMRACFLAFAFWFTCNPDCETYVSPATWLVLYAFWYLIL